MNVAYVHYHLRPGGVTRVILDELESLRGEVNALVITGEPPAFPVPFPYVHLPSLAYDSELREKTSPEALARSIAASARKAWAHDPCIFHVHNPTLGKTRALIGALKILKDKGEKLLLHIHDLAEDGRPELFSAEEYPSDCHYAVINRRDFGILGGTGLKAEGLHYIPDAVRPLQVPDGSGPGGRIILYPVRAIRRKNIGEAVLLSLFVSEGQTLGITLEPTGALDRRSCRDWKDFVRDEGLPVLFGLGDARGFESVLAETSAFVTTSVKEGFGLSYLEPWTARTMLFGRLLEETCLDFIEKGLRLDHLYRSIRVPINFFDLGAFERKWRKCYAERLERYGIARVEERIERYFHGLHETGCIDFGYLSEDLQREILRKVIGEAKSRTQLSALNPFLDGMFASPGVRDIVETNREIALKEYSLINTGNSLREVYNAVMSRQVSHSIDKGVLVRAFNSPENNHLLLCSSAYE